MTIRRISLRGRPRRLIFAAVSTAAVLVISYGWGSYVEPPVRRLTPGEVAALAGVAAPAERRGRFWVLNRNGEKIYAAETRDYAPGEVGYGGEFNLLVVVTPEGVVERVVVVRHAETPSYLSDLPAFIKSFAGVSATSPMRIGRDVDAMTRATVTSRAFAHAVHLTAAGLYRDAAGGPRVPATPAPGRDWLWAAVTAAFFAAALWLRKGPAAWARWGAYAAAVCALGFAGGRFVSLADVGRFVLFKFPPCPAALTTYVLIGGAVVTAVCVGNVYCGWVCPFGALAEWLYRLPTPKLMVPMSYARKLSFVRLAVLSVAVGVIVATRKLTAAEYEPFDDLFAFTAAGLSVGLLATILITSVFHYRFFCRYLCGVGGMLGALSPGAPVSGRAAEGCNQCGDCASACGMGVFSAAGKVAEPSLCVNCGRCLAACRRSRRAG